MGWVVSLLGDIQNLTGHGPQQPARVDPAPSRGLDKESSSTALPPHPLWLSWSIRYKDSNAVVVVRLKLTKCIETY